MCSSLEFSRLASSPSNILATSDELSSEIVSPGSRAHEELLVNTQGGRGIYTRAWVGAFTIHHIGWTLLTIFKKLYNLFT